MWNGYFCPKKNFCIIIAIISILLVHCSASLLDFWNFYPLLTLLLSFFMFVCCTWVSWIIIFRLFLNLREASIPVPHKVIDTGGGFLLEEETETTSTLNVVHRPGIEDIMESLTFKNEWLTEVLANLGLSLYYIYGRKSLYYIWQDEWSLASD